MLGTSREVSSGWPGLRRKWDPAAGCLVASCSRSPAGVLPRLPGSTAGPGGGAAHIAQQASECECESRTASVRSESAALVGTRKAVAPSPRSVRGASEVDRGV